MRTLIIKPKWHGLTTAALLVAISLSLIGLATASGPQCTAPYVNVSGGPGCAAFGSTRELTIQSIHIGEPLVSCSNKSLTVVIKVNTLDPQNSGMVTPLANAVWEAQFVVPASALSFPTGRPADQTISVSWDTEIIPTGAFNFGFVDNNPIPVSIVKPEFPYASQCTPGLGTCAATGTVNTDGTITITLDMTSPLSFTDSMLVHRFDMSALPAGTQLTSIAANSFVCACAAQWSALQRRPIPRQ